jgi:hypothetical protein
MRPSRALLAVIYAGTASTLAHAQASLDYAARSVGSVLPNGPGQMSLGACPVDGSVISCVHQYYPTIFNFSLLGMVFGAAFLLIPKNKF